MKGSKRLLLLVVFLLCAAEPLYAQYTLVLKNGRRITIQSYREEGTMIKFPGMGGEIGISKDQVQSILKAGEPESRGMSIIGLEKAPTPPAAPSPEEKKEAGRVPAGEQAAEGKEKVLSPEERLREERARDEKEYQNKVKQLTEQIKSLSDRFSLATRGSSGPEPTLLQTEEAIRARSDDLTTRLRDAGLVPELRPGETAPRVEVPLPGYTGREKDLSDLRNQINQLQRDRQSLIEQMKQKNLDTGGLFLE